MINYFDFQSKIIFVDDNPVFLNAMRSAMASQKHTFFIEEESQFLEFMEEDETENKLKSLFCDEDNDSDLQSVISVDLDEIADFIINMHRNKECPVSIIFMDYSLPETTGLDILQKVYQKEVRKVLLTGEMNDNKAIQALNARTIHGYISKRTENLKEEIEKLIDFNKRIYVQRINQMFDSIFSTNDLVTCLYKDKDFEAFYIQKCEELSVISAVIYEPFGSRVLITKSETYLLNIYWEDEIKGFVIPCSGPHQAELERGSVVLDYKRLGNTNLPADSKKWQELITSGINKFSIEGQTVYVTICPAEI